MRRPGVIDRPGCGDQSLGNDETAEDPLPAAARTMAAEDVLLDPFEIERLQELVDGRHRANSLFRRGAYSGSIERASSGSMIGMPSRIG